MMVEPQSICHWFDERESSKCGYCKSTSGSVQYGMWAQSLKVEDYQILIDRGWRRSGQYCYKPLMKETCCPLYTIRCAARDFHPSKSQKKVIKKLNKFLNIGILKDIVSNVPSNPEFHERVMDDFKKGPVKEIDLKYVSTMKTDSKMTQVTNSKYSVSESNSSKLEDATEVVQCTPSSSRQCDTLSKSNSVKKGMGADPTKPPCKKAKVMRYAKKLKKLENVGQDKESSNHQQPKSLEQFMNAVSTDDKHKLITKLIEPSNPSSEWHKYEQLEFELFKKYQSVIHNDPPHKNNLEGFSRFLVHSPLEREEPSGINASSSGPTYGSYHQQYWLDDKLIAVGVIDILPKCVSAVYFFYDPDYRELTLGTYGALKEIQLTRDLYPTLNTEFYYMGYYIHSCQKMRYKGNMAPSFLLCPETYRWFPIEKCTEKLDKTKYCRFNEDLATMDEYECTINDLEEIQIIVKRRYMTYKMYKTLYKREDVYVKIGELIGKECARSLIFIES